MRKILSFLLIIIGLCGYSQDEYYRKVDWKFYPENVIQLTDSTYLTDAYPFDYNDVGAIRRVVGNYVVDFVGHRYSVIDSTSTTITVLDIYHIGQAPQTGQIARCYRSVGNGEAEYIGSIDYSPLDESSRWKLNGSDNELLWRQTVGKAENGLYKDARTVKLGGDLIEPTTINQDNNSLKILNNGHGSAFSETGIAYTKIDTVDFTDSTLVTKMYVKSLIKEGTSHDSLTISAGSTGYFDVNYPQIFSGQKLIDTLGVMNTKIAGKAPASGSANYVQVSPASAQLGDINMSGVVKLGNLGDRSGLSRFLLSDSITGSISAHGFADNNIVELVGVGYNSFDSKPIFGGSSYYDHAVAFQSIPEYASSGNIGILYGLFNRFNHTGTGVIDRGIGIYLGAHSGAGTFNKIYGVITQQGAGNSGFGIETPVTQVQIDATGLTSLPANSGTTPSSGTNSRFSAQSKTSAILDIGNNGSDGLWLQASDFTDLSQKYPLLLNPNGGDVVFGGKVRIIPNSPYYGEQIQINEVAPKVTFRADGGYYWSAGVTSAANDAKYVIRYESDSKDLITIDRSYNILFGGIVDAPTYKLSGVDLYSSLSANTLQKWDGAKHTSIANSSGYLYNDGSGNMSWIKTVPQSLSGTTPSLNVSNGVNANISISGATTLTLSNLISGTSGTIYLTNNASVYRIKIAGYTIAPASNITYDSTGILLPASSVYTHTSIGWYYNGTTVQIHKADYNLTTY